ncbi:MAG: MMPL family transporter [Candidatus Delongbacteria bacterium]|nr:MMPL family transporter [Candidatus Delongbacteria bacterium]
MKLSDRTLLTYSWVSVFLIVLATAFFTYQMKTYSTMETDLDEYMPKDHPAFVYSDQAEEWFNIKDGILIAVENAEGIYNPSTLQKIKDISIGLQDMDEFDDADIVSLYTADNITGSEEGLDVRAFYKKVPKETETLEELRASVRSNDMVYKRLISENENISLVVASMNDDVFSMEFYHKILKFAKSYEGPEKIHIAGVPIVEGTMAYLGPADMKRMVPIVLLVIIAVLFYVMRSVKNTIFTLLVVGLSTIWAFGLMAFLRIPVYAVSTMMPVMLIAIGVADGIHLYSHLNLHLKANPGISKFDAVKDMLASMWKPVVMTSVTTAVGFVSLLTSEVYPIKYFGLFTAFGVMAAMVFSLVLIPAGIIIFGASRPKIKEPAPGEKNSSEFSHRFARSVIKHKYAVVAVTAVILIISALGINNIWINSSFLDKFEKDSDIVQTDTFINQNFGGTNTINVVLESFDADAFKTPEFLRMIDEMQSGVEKLEIVGNSFSLADYLKRMNKVMNADDPEFDRIPDSKDLVAQYLLLYEMSGDPENLWKVVDYNYNKANVNFQIKSDNSKEINKVMSEIEKFRPGFEEKNITLNYAGSGYKALVFTDLILIGQIKSLLMSILIVIILIAMMFKSITAGIIGSVPIIITAVISFGLMGLLDIPLSTTTALISSIAVGIGIDYAIHFIERFKIYAQETKDVELTVVKTMHHSGRAISFNAVVVIAGFLVLLSSVFPPNRSLGALVSLNMLTSFIGTITIMFLILYRSGLFFKNKKGGLK